MVDFFFIWVDYFDPLMSRTNIAKIIINKLETPFSNYKVFANEYSDGMTALIESDHPKQLLQEISTKEVEYKTRDKKEIVIFTHDHEMTEKTVYFRVSSRHK